MDFDEAVKLAQMIRATETWFVLEVAPVSGAKLEDDTWGVMAISTLNWHTINYWNRPGTSEQWPQIAQAWRDGQARRHSTHDQ